MPTPSCWPPCPSPSGWPRAGSASPAWPPWPPVLACPADAVTLLVMEGLLTRTARCGAAVCAEMVGPGDLLLPMEIVEDEYLEGDFAIEWRVRTQPASVAVLGAEFALAAGRWPALGRVLAARMAVRTRALLGQMAVSHIRRLDARTLALLWLLAERHGRVGPHGTVLVLPLTHRLLADLTGARRPSITAALRILTEGGAVSRAPEGTFVLHERPSLDRAITALPAPARAAARAAAPTLAA